MTAPAAKDAAARQRRSRERKALTDEGYALVNDVPVAPESIDYLIAADVFPASAKEDPSRPIGKFLEFCARPRVAAAIRREMEDVIAELKFDEEYGVEVSGEEFAAFSHNVTSTGENESDG